MTTHKQQVAECRARLDPLWADVVNTAIEALEGRWEKYDEERCRLEGEGYSAKALWEAQM